MSDAAVATLVTGLVTITTLVCGVATLWLKIREGNRKLDHNTDLTRAGTLVAAQSAKAAVSAAVDVKVATDNIERKLNGGVDAALTTALEPITARLIEHTGIDEKNMADINVAFRELTEYVHKHTGIDEKNMADINVAFRELTEYVHKRNHDVLDALQVQTNKMETILVKLGQIDKDDGRIGGAW